MAIDIYSPRVMIPALRESKPVRRFLTDTFFSQQRTYRTENIDLDQQIKGRRIAPFTNKWGPSKPVDRQGFDTSSVTPPHIGMKMVITAQDVSTRVMGEDVYENRDPAARARQLLADDLMTLQEMLARREELMVRDVIYDSALTVSGDDTAITYTFTRDSDLTIGTLTGDNAWDSANSDPILAIDTWCETYAKVSGFSPTDLIMGSTAYQTFVDQTKVKAKLDLLRMDLGSIRPQGLPDGVRMVGSLFGALNLWTYSEWYDDPDASGTTTALIPAKKILLASRNMRTELRYGAVQTLTGNSDNDVPTLVEAVAYPRSWVGKDPPVRYLELRSRPLPVPIQNYFLTAQVQA